MFECAFGELDLEDSGGGPQAANNRNTVPVAQVIDKGTCKCALHKVLMSQSDKDRAILDSLCYLTAQNCGRMMSGNLSNIAVTAPPYMRKARELLLSLAPQGFTMSLSTCYNYTDSYRQGSAQAKRHHANRAVNASLSLRNPPWIVVDQLVVNLHWSTANVNRTVDTCQETCSYNHI